MTRRLTRPVVLLVLGLVGAAVLAWQDEPACGTRPLNERVTIRRDTFGIPHIFGETEEAAAFGLGYAQAEDHLEAIARRIIRARGEAARAFGPSALENDVAMRRVDNLGEARRAVRVTLGKQFRAVIQAFAAGINHYIRQHRAEIPPWVQELDAADILANTRSGAGAAGGAALVRSLREKYPGGEAPGQPPKPPGAGSAPVVDPALDPDEAPDEPGSNALALGGSRTTSGRPILLGNPHLQRSSLYWEAHIIVPGRINFYGSTLVGFPWLRAGFNDRLGYVQTNNAPDLADVFALTVDPADPGSYVFDGRPRPFQSKDVAVEVQQPDGSVRSERRTYLSSHLGPIVYRTPKLAFAYRSTASDAWRHFESFFDLSHVKNLREFLRILHRGQNPTSNYTYADADGNILYQWNALLPRRRDAGTSYELDVPAEGSKQVWRKLHRLGDLPRLLNPAGGSIQNANNPPWFVSLRNPLDPSRFPSYVERGELALRPQLALQMLEAPARFSPDDVVALKFTTRMLLADRVKPALLEAARAVAEPGADLTRGIELLAAWSVLAYGQTTRRDSPHSRDQIHVFAARQLWPIWFTEAEIRAHLEREYRASTRFLREPPPVRTTSRSDCPRPASPRTWLRPRGG